MPVRHRPPNPKAVNQCRQKPDVSWRGSEDRPTPPSHAATLAILVQEVFRPVTRSFVFRHGWGLSDRADTCDFGYVEVVKMLFDSLRLLSPFVIVLLSIPLAIFAVFTTWIAISTLLIRVSAVYFELAIALVHSWLFIEPPAKTRSSIPLTSSHSSNRSSPTRRRHRRSSLVSNASSAELTTAHRPAKSDSFVSLVGTSEPNRDFEGVGGWRLAGEASEDALWIGMNSRLELPAVTPGRQRKHQRSLTSGTQRWSWGAESIRMSPVQSRARTPNTSMETLSVTEGYFTIQPHGKSAAGGDPTTSTADMTRRKSLGSSSTSSASSSRTLRKTTKQL